MGLERGRLASRWPEQGGMGAEAKLDGSQEETILASAIVLFKDKSIGLLGGPNGFLGKPTSRQLLRRHQKKGGGVSWLASSPPGGTCPHPLAGARG
jgi:hypothetical protein